MQYIRPTYVDRLPVSQLGGIYREISDTPRKDRIYYESRSGDMLFQVYYGIGVTHNILEKYARDRHLIRPDAKFGILEADKVAHHLSDVARMPLQLCPVVSKKHDYVLALYSNYTKWERELETEDEVDVLNIINSELGTNESFLWFHHV